MLNLVNLDQNECKKLFIEAQESLLNDWNNKAYDKSYRQVLNILPKLMEKHAVREADLVPYLQNYTFE